MTITPQFSNYLMSSAYLWLDHLILNELKAFENASIRFYNVASLYYPYNTVASPYGQIVSDASISGANILTTVYFNGSPRTTGVSGLIDIDYSNGRVYTSGGITSTITGYGGVKYFNVFLTEKTEQEILVETAYSLRPRTTMTVTGVNLNQVHYPIIYLKNNGGYSDPLAFGGMDNTVDLLRVIILTDSQVSLEAVNSALRDTARTNIPVFTSGQMPFNTMGGLRTGSYNYNALKQAALDQDSLAFIKSVYISKYNQSYNDIRKLNPRIYWSIVDLTVETYRYPRA